ncbi:MAG: hypothetical protein IJV40_02355 [Oscillospiraceae bacterium]|nr:hypothetical protein [Oscillospiraceae bacterium]
MEKLNTAVDEEMPARVKKYVSAGLQNSACSEEGRADILASLDEMLPGLLKADGGVGSLIVSVENTASGSAVQMMHAGPIYNPCPSGEESFTRSHMDEISFEFKYGRNVLTVFRRANTNNN